MRTKQQINNKVKNFTGKPTLLEAKIELGRRLTLAYSASMAFWYLMSHYGGGGTLSFLWVVFPGVVAFFVIGYVSALFCRKQKE